MRRGAVGLHCRFHAPEMSGIRQVRCALAAPAVAASERRGCDRWCARASECAWRVHLCVESRARRWRASPAAHSAAPLRPAASRIQRSGPHGPSRCCRGAAHGPSRSAHPICAQFFGAEMASRARSTRVRAGVQTKSAFLGLDIAVEDALAVQSLRGRDGHAVHGTKQSKARHASARPLVACRALGLRGCPSGGGRSGLKAEAVPLNAMRLARSRSYFPANPDGPRQISRTGVGESMHRVRCKSPARDDRAKRRTACRSAD